jgi:hypothetical protein
VRGIAPSIYSDTEKKENDDGDNFELYAAISKHDTGEGERTEESQYSNSP